MGSLKGAFIASLLIGFVQTFAVAIDYKFADLLQVLGVSAPEVEGLLDDIYHVSIAQLGPLLPYLMLVLMLIFRPRGLFGKREV